MTKPTAMIGHPDEMWRLNPLLATKFYIPPMPSHFVFRPQLIQRLEEGMQGKLTLISAGAGFGKSSLLSEWCSRQEAQQGQGRSITWVSLDKGDNDPVHFWGYVFAALEQIQPGSSKDALLLLQSPEPVASTLIVTSLINIFLSISREIVLILDDYHTITNMVIHQGLAFLLDHLPPQLHLVISSRSDPPLMLARLRSRGQLNELRDDDLRFHLEETMTFLNTATDLTFSKEAVAILDQRTEGWIAGLYMAALSLKGHSDSVAFINVFAGSHRYILDYLSEEVLNQQSEVIQHFLVQTSILERLSGPLCEAVTEQPKSQAILEKLEQSNLFIVPLDDQRGWYRYHHLFTDVLRRQLQQTQPELIPQLHRRATAWYEQQGFINEAVQHALAAADHTWAALLMEQAAPMMLLRGERNTLQQWIQGLPQETLHSRPRLCIASASLLATSSARLEEVEPYLQMAETQLLTISDDGASAQVQEMLGEIDAIRANLARQQSDFLRAIPLFEQALKRIPTENAFERALICMHLGASLVYTGKVELAVPILIEALEQGHLAGSLYSLMQAFYRFSWILMIQGRLHISYTECQRALLFVDAATHQGDSMHAGVVFIALGNILREWNDLNTAAQVLSKGIEGCKQSGELVLMGVGYLYLAHVRLEQGALDEAQTILHTVEHVVQHRRLTIPFNTRIPFYQVRLWLARGELDTAIQWVRDRRSQLDSSLGYLYALECLTIARVLLVQGREKKGFVGEHPLEDALLMIEQTRLSAETDGRESQVIDAWNVQALVLQEQGNASGAMEALKHSLALAEPEGYIRLFVDEGKPMATLLQRAFASGVALNYVTILLSALETQPLAEETIKQSFSSVLPPLFDPLSERELDVLHLITEGHSNQEIAQALYVSLGTVKTHLKHIYGKLDVHTRTQAIARARELQILFSDP